MKIGFLASANPLDRNSFSGTLFYMYHALQKRVDVEVKILAADFHAKRDRTARLWSLLDKHTGHRVEFARRFNSRKTTQLIKHLSAELSVSATDFDLLLAPVASELLGEIPEGLLKVPVIYLSDATVSFLRNEYDWTLDKEHERWEETASRVSAISIYSSDFMAERAIQDYGIKIPGLSERTFTALFGLNMDAVPAIIPQKSAIEPIRLLFVGRDWVRKGGPVAVGACNWLRQNGMTCELTIVGCDPFNGEGQPGIQVIPCLDKNRADEQKKYVDLLSAAHFLLLPTKADCTPMVIAEANAFGVPAIVSSIGGIPSLLKNGVNGFLMPPGADAGQWGECILQAFCNDQCYLALSHSSRQQYERELTWDAWAEKVVQLGVSLLEGN